MARKRSLRDKKEWLSQFEDGKTETQIARILQRDPRTITKGIEEAIKDRSLTHAEDDLLRDALRGHQEQLKDVLEGGILFLRYHLILLNYGRMRTALLRPYRYLEL